TGNRTAKPLSNSRSQSITLSYYHLSHRALPARRTAHADPQQHRVRQAQGPRRLRRPPARPTHPPAHPQPRRQRRRQTRKGRQVIPSHEKLVAHLTQVGDLPDHWRPSFEQVERHRFLPDRVLLPDGTTVDRQADQDRWFQVA